MEFIIAESTEDMSRRAADRIASFVEADPSCVLGLATGTTPIGLYACLVDYCAQDKISFADVTIATVSSPISLASLAMTGDAPVPVPPPMPAVMKSMRVPDSSRC